MNSKPESETPVSETEIVQPSALEAMERANVDMLVSTAKRYPRDIQKSKREALKIVTLDPDTAAECFFKYERGGKVIQGPSIRLAEIVASTWGNIRAGSRTIQETETTVVAQAFCHDTENNVFIAKEVERKIVNKDGRRFNEDIIILTKNANCSIALRNAVFSVVPRAVINTIYDEAVKAAIGDIKTLAERVTKALSKFAAMGITQERVLARFKLERVDEFTPAHLEEMFGLYTAVNDKEITVDEAFPPVVKKGSIGQQPTDSGNAGLTSTPSSADKEMSDEAALTELQRRMGVDGVTEFQILGYCRLKEVKLATDKQVELMQLAGSKLKMLLSSWASILPNIRKQASA